MILVGNSNIACFNQQGLALASAKEPVEVHWVGALQIDHFLNDHPAGARVRKLLSCEPGWKFLSIGTHDIFGLCQLASLGMLEAALEKLPAIYRLVFTQLRGDGKFGWLFFPQPLHQLNFQGLASKDIFDISQRFHKIISGVCQELAIPVIAPLSKLVDKQGEPRKALVQRDGIHLNIEGIKIYLEEITSLTGDEIRFTSRDRLFEPASEVESFCSLLLDELRIPQKNAPVEFDFVKTLSDFISRQLRERGIDLEVDGETELVDSGLLDSLNLVETYTFAVDLLKIEIPFDVDLRKLNTPAKISEFLLLRKKDVEGDKATTALSQADFMLSLRGDFNDPEQKPRILEADRRIAAMSDELFRAFQENVAVVSHGVSIRYCIILFWIALNKASRRDYKSALEYLEASTDHRRAFPFLSPRLETYKSEWQTMVAKDIHRQEFLWELPVDASVITAVANRQSTNADAKVSIVYTGNRQVQEEAKGEIEIIRKDDASREYLVTALVSTYNSERFIRGCLEDLEAQTIADKIEILVIDSASTQNERAIVLEFQKRYDNIVYVRTPMREKLYAAWNRGIRMAKGKYITNTNTDDRRLSYALEAEALALTNFPNAGLVYADIWGTTIENDILRPDDTARFRRYSYSEFTPLNGLTGSNFSPQPMWRKDVHETVGFFDENYVIAGDYEFFFRVARQFNALHIKTPLGLYLENATGIEKSQPTLTREEFKQLRYKFYSEISLDEFFPRLSINSHDREARGHAFFELGNNCLIASLLPEYQLAMDYYGKAREFLGDKPQLLHNMAMAKIGMGDTKGAIELLKVAAKNFPPSALSLEAIETSAGNIRQLPAAASQVFFSDHLVAKSARQGLGIELEKIMTPPKPTAGSAASVNQVPPQFQHKDMKAGMISIVIITQYRPDQIKKFVKHIQKHTAEPHEIILIEDKDHSGFAKGVNQGIKASQGEFILLLHNDVAVADGWLSGMLECLNSAPEAGIVGPMTNNCTGLQQVIDKTYRSVDYLDKYAVKFKEQYHHRHIYYRNIAGFCMLFKRTLAEKIGLFDEQFDNSPMASEDFCLRAALADYRNYIAGDVFIHHHGDKESSGDRSMIEKKWLLGMNSPEGRKLAVLTAIETADNLYQKGKFDEAVAVLVDCIKLTPDAQEIYYELARIFIDTRKFAEAWQVMESMPEAAKNDLKGLAYAGYAKEGLSQDEEAAAYADRMLSQKENDPAALNLKGVLAFKKGEEEKAAEYFKKTIDADPGYGEAYTNLGVLYLRMNKKFEALAHLRKGFVLAPTVPDASSLYYSGISSLGTFSDAQADFRDACGLYPNHKNLAFLYIDILIQQGQYDLAMTIIEDALDSFGLDDDVLTAALAVREKIGSLQIEAGAHKNTLSLCMIVKNEEKHLVKCLKSVRDVVDEMIIVDTGSTDKTKDIATVFGAQVFDFPWTGDFSAARNESLTHATGDWILILDADEVISALDHKRLRKIIDKEHKQPVAYDINTRNYFAKSGSAGWTENDGSYPEEERGIGWYGSNKVRLFQNNNLLMFENPVHELVEASVRRAGIPIETCNIPIHHYGRFDYEKLMAKGRDYYLLGRKKLEERGGDDYDALRELAIQATEIKKYDDAVDLWQRALALRPDNAEALFNLAFNYVHIGKYQEGLQAAKRSYELSPETSDAVLNYALCQMLTGSVSNINTIIETFISSGNKSTTLLTVLGASYFIGGEDEKGTTIFKNLAEKGVNSVPSYINSIVVQLINSGQLEYARLLIDKTLSGNFANRDTLRLRLELEASAK